MKYSYWLALLPTLSMASPATSGSMLSAQLGSVIMSLLLIVVIIFLLAWLTKKMNPQIVNQDDFKVVRSLSVGHKERLLVVEIDGKHHLLGVTSQQINYLYQLESTLAENELPQLAKTFQQLLQVKKK